jgi:hypothetical protein
MIAFSRRHAALTMAAAGVGAAIVPADRSGSASSMTDAWSPVMITPWDNRRPKAVSRWKHSLSQQLVFNRHHVGKN